MQRRVFVSAAAGAALVGSPGGAQAQQVVWEDVASANGRYRLKMPKGYRYLTVPGHGGVLHSYVVMLPDRFILEFLDVALANPVSTIPTDPAALQAALQQVQGGMQKSWPGSTVIEQRPITTGPITGREFVFAADQGSRVVIVRMYLTPTATYTQIVQAPMADRQNPVTTQFMDSLRFG
ncbi:MAG: hypothetical protein PSV46_22465 [Reyranella sp.]|nr:hypothetical protein [Reyranella sp.]